MDLEHIREHINVIDFRLIKMLSERMELALRAGKLKDVIHDPNREQEIYDRIRNFSSTVIRPEFTEKLFKEILKESKWLQEHKKKLVGFQGEHGAYGEIAAKHIVPKQIPIPCLEFVEVFEGVEEGKIDYGIVPVENSLEGAVTQVNDLLVETNLKIIGEVRVPITHCLLALPDTDYREIKVVYSHPQALAQCRGFLDRNKLESRPWYDTAGAAQMISNDMPKAAAAIASPLCAELYNLQIIKDRIEDHESNSTRFIMLAKENDVKNGNKCSIIFSTKHQAGQLHHILQIFSDANLNLTRIESRPIRLSPGKYAFLLDFQGSNKDKNVQKTLQQVEQETDNYKFLGCYEEAQL